MPQWAAASESRLMIRSKIQLSCVSKAFTRLADWAAQAFAAPLDPLWRMEQDGYQAALEHEVESRFAISNGFLGVRASLEQPTIASRPRTFIAGLFDTAPGEVPLPRLVPGPDWLRLQLLVEGEPLAIEAGQTLAHRRTLDLRRGVLLGDWRQRDGAGHLVELRTLRFVSLANRMLAVQVVSIAVDRPAQLALEAGLEPPADGLSLVRAAPALTIWRTTHTAKYLAVASGMALRLDQRAIRPAVDADGRDRWHWNAAPDQPAIFARIVAFARGDGEDDRGAAVRAELHAARRATPPRLLETHTRAWAERWRASEVVVEGDDVAQTVLRFAGYHMISAANPDDQRISIGARALTGDAYLGHVFWDTEMFLLPFYTYTWPAAARTLLLYRFHTLEAARAKAARLGYRGALYAWESAESGEEATPPYVRGPDGQVIPIRNGVEEQHISADVAYAAWQYWQATEDVPFLLDAGAEMILETARFWASRATLESDSRYHIRKVIGPDEYHEGVDDNAYTNGMAQWNIERALELAELLPRRWPARWAPLREQLALTPAELAVWRDVAARLVTGLDKTSGLIEQFAGFFALEPLDLAAYTPRTAPMDVLLGRERTQRSQVIKQADVVMLLALLWDSYDAALRLANFRYYEPRCGHGSSLSPAIHALVAARLGDVELAARYFHQAAAIDLDDTMGNAAGGVHIATLGGLWQAALFGFGGISPTTAGLRCDPHLPTAWRALDFPLQWCGRQVRIALRQAPLTLSATLEHGRPLILEVGSLRHELRAGSAWTCRWSQDELRWQEVEHDCS
jgi:trehalose/maltose hydrolase-like predicted phosphorylase